MPLFQMESKWLNSLGETQNRQNRKAVLQRKAGFQVETSLSAQMMTYLHDSRSYRKKHTVRLQDLIYFRNILFSDLLRKTSFNQAFLIRVRHPSCFYTYTKLHPDIFSSFSRISVIIYESLHKVMEKERILSFHA